ncbi:MAG: hypothetical protein HY017_32555 [Betaproteobacteria bacterium]|nr:hypothetical protein [Betaproteobacteria bacterium]
MSTTSVPEPHMHEQTYERIDLAGPAKLEDVVRAILVLAKHDEVELANIVNAGELHEVFPFEPRTHAAPASLGRFDDITEAPARALTDEEYEDFLRGGRGTVHR